MIILPLGQLYLAGATVWSCIIAIYRVLHIKAQQWVKNHFEDTNFLKVLLSVGLLVNFALSFLLAFYDNEGVNQKLCTRFSSKDIEILLQLKVILLNVSQEKVLPLVKNIKVIVQNGI
jgi:hypothetical protein